MATKAIAIPMDEYLRTSYEWEPEWVDGELVERSLPTYAHSKTQQRIGLAVGNAENAIRLFCRPQLRIQVSPTRWRIPDLSIFADKEPTGDYPSNVYSVVEIVSPADAVRELDDKVEEYAAMGVRYIWVLHPDRQRIQKYDNENLIRVPAIEFPERGFRLTAQEIFA